MPFDLTKHTLRGAVCFLLLLVLPVHGQSAGGEVKSDRQKYIDAWKSIAVQQMQSHGIPASITLAQGILESGNGTSMLTQQANNHFGIKCHGWNGPGVYKDDDKKNECFRKYSRAEDSFKDHSEFLQRKRYQFLFELDPKDYKGWARGLKKAGYATDPQYARRLIKLIEDNDLHRFDRFNDLAYEKKREETNIRPRFEEKRAVMASDREVIDLTKKIDIRIHPNGIKYIQARSGDDVRSIAREMEMADWQLKRYNDVPSEYRFNEGETIFLQPKKKKAKADYHLAVEGESLREISQRYGVKLKKLQEYNGLTENEPLQRGHKVRLKRPPK